MDVQSVSEKELELQAVHEYEKWRAYPHHSAEIIEELQRMQDHLPEIVECFGHDLDFGTGGLRGIIGAGRNRMNRYTVRKASLALAKYVLRTVPEAAKRGIVIGYDCRRGSKEYAEEVGLTCAAAGVKGIVTPYLCPTPELSFAVRTVGAAAGVMITASHNPPEYNGYKVYGADGGQILPDVAKVIRALMDESEDVFAIPVFTLAQAKQSGRFEWLSEDIRQRYIQAVVRELSFAAVRAQMKENLRVVYTPLHGTGLIPVRETMTVAGYPAFHVFAPQASPDGEFPTVQSPNPEEPEALAMAIEYARQIQADLVLGTDPDADRVGIAIHTGAGDYQLLNGNQVGALLINFLLEMRQQEGTLPKQGIVFNTIVTSELGAKIARAKGIPCESTLTGFKYIGDRISQYEKSGEFQFLFGYEESYGYLLSDIVRDKDAVQACYGITAMTAYYKAQGQTLFDVLDGLYQQYGYYQEALLNFTLKGLDGLARMQTVLARLRQEYLKIPGLSLKAVEDYTTLTCTEFVTLANDVGHAEGSTKPLELPSSDVLKYFYEDGTWIAVRPSGTEPKLKAYVAVRGDSQAECAEKVNYLRNIVQQLVQSE